MPHCDSLPIWPMIKQRKVKRRAHHLGPHHHGATTSDPTTSPTISPTTLDPTTSEPTTPDPATSEPATHPAFWCPGGCLLNPNHMYHVHITHHDPKINSFILLTTSNKWLWARDKREPHTYRGLCTYLPCNNCTPKKRYREVPTRCYYLNRHSHSLN